MLPERPNRPASRRASDQRRHVGKRLPGPDPRRQGGTGQANDRAHRITPRCGSQGLPRPLFSYRSRASLRPCPPSRPGIAPSCSPAPSARCAASGSRRRVAARRSCRSASWPATGASLIARWPTCWCCSGAGNATSRRPARRWWGCGRPGIRTERIAGRVAGGADWQRSAVITHPDGARRRLSWFCNRTDATARG
jgi:hypothetical protein